MDIKVVNKDIVIGDNGMPVMIDGLDQAIQQIRLSAIVEKGSFIYDREMGIEVSDEILEKDNATKVVESMLNELLIDIPWISVTVDSIESSLEYKSAFITITDGYETKKAEVIIRENV